MPTVNINMIVSQATYLKNNEGISESEAIQKSLQASGISEEQIAEMGLEEEISRVMNLSHEDQAREAEQQLQQQAQGYQADILKVNEGLSAENEADMQGAPDPNA